MQMGDKRFFAAFGGIEPMNDFIRTRFSEFAGSYRYRNARPGSKWSLAVSSYSRLIDQNPEKIPTRYPASAATGKGEVGDLETVDV
jgi:hypothetical protein